MGRMADARKKAQARAAGQPAPPAPEPVTADAARIPGPGEPALAAEETAPEADFVFPAEPGEGAEASPAPERLAIPSSGLAEDVLPRIRAVITPHAPGEALPSGRIELPASGLAEEILARHESGSLAAEPRSEAHVHAHEPGRESSLPAPAGAHSLAFFAAPAQEQRAAAEATEHLATFYLDREEYGVDVRQVQEIRRLTEITTVPRAPQFIRGVINLRGRILPVLDLRSKLGLGQIPESRAARIIVVRVKDRVLGLLVDGASQVLKIPLSRIEPAPQEVVERGGDYIRGVAKLDDRLIILVDLERLLAHELHAPGSPSGSAPRAAVGSDA